MAWLEKRGETYHIGFFHGGKHYSRSLKTGQERKAQAAKVRLEDNLADVERGRLDVPMCPLPPSGRILRRMLPNSHPKRG